MTVLVVDAANVVGSVPDGWWRDRPGAAARLHEHLVTSVMPYDAVVLVLEGRARSGVPEGVSDGTEHDVTTVHAPGSGDDEVVARCRELAADGAQVDLATADRGLIDRVTGLGVRIVSPRGVRGRERHPVVHARTSSGTAGRAGAGMTFQPTRRTGLNRTLLLRPGAPWHGRPAGRVLGARGCLELPDWVDALGHLVRTLTAPTDTDLAAREEWGPDDWDRWAAVDRIVLSGGVVAGAAGHAAVHHLGGGGDADKVDGRRPTVELAPDPASGPLAGLAAYPSPSPDLLVLDLGHSSIKAATARAGVLGPVVRVPVPWRPFDTSTWPAPQALLDLLARAAAEARLDGADPPLREARVAVANYVVDGQLDADATYGRLRELDADPVALVSRAVDLPVTLFVNDGQAAALSYAGHAGLACITVGTSLGVGFPPPSAPPGWLG